MSAIRIPMPKAVARLNFLIVDLHLAARNVLRQRRRTAIGLVAICFGVVAMMLSAGYIEWIFRANKEFAVHQLGHVQISLPGYHEAGLSDPYRYLMTPGPSVTQIVEHLPQTVAVAPRLNFNGLVSHGDSTLSFIGEGLDPDKDPSSQNVLVTQGSGLSNQDPKGIILGAGLAANLGVRAGDAVVLLANTPSGGINAVEANVRGLIVTSMRAYDDNILRVPIAMARKLMRTEGEHLLVIKLHDTGATEGVVAHLKAQPSFKGLEIVPWSQMADFYKKTVALFSRQMDVVKLIIAVIIMLSISNTMTMSVRERTVEIGTAMALGIPRKRILSLFLLEGGLLGAVGGVLGVTFGILGAHVISAVGIPMPPAPGMSRGYIAGIDVTAGIVVQALALAVTTTLLASLYPAWRASRLDIVDALRHNR